jgi:hypothetical protein
MIGNPTIMSENITASSVDYGAGIGTGYANGYGTSAIGNLTIVSGKITPHSVEYGSGIRTGRGIEGSTAVIGTLSILGGRIRSFETESGIGSGFRKRCGRGILEGGSTRESTEDPYPYHRASNSQDPEIPRPGPEICREFVDASKSSTPIEKAGQLPQFETIDDDLPTGPTSPDTRRELQTRLPQLPLAIPRRFHPRHRNRMQFPQPL